MYKLKTTKTKRKTKKRSVGVSVHSLAPLILNAKNFLIPHWSQEIPLTPESQSLDLNLKLNPANPSSLLPLWSEALKFSFSKTIETLERNFHLINLLKDLHNESQLQKIASNKFISPFQTILANSKANDEKVIWELAIPAFSPFPLFQAV